MSRVATRRAHANARQCTSCWETKPSSDYFASQPLEQCQHDNSICRVCWEEWISVSVASQYQTRIECPMTDCDSFAHGERDLRRLARPKDHLRYNYITTRINRSNTPNLHWCLNPKCGVRLSTELDGACSECLEYTCIECNTPDHGAGTTCEEYQLLPEVIVKKEEDTKSSQLIEQMQHTGKIKACPNCACLIEAENPSGKVKCGRCLYYFKWNSPSPTTTMKEERSRPGGKQNVRFIIEASDEEETRGRNGEYRGRGQRRRSFASTAETTAFDGRVALIAMVAEACKGR